MSLVAVQTDFDFIVPVRKELQTVAEVGDVLRVERTTVYEMILAGELEMIRRPGLEKSHQRITRRSLLAHLARGANFETEDFVATIATLARTLTPARRRALAQVLLAD